jgi:hypothetical protein
MKAQPIPKGSCAACYLATMDSASSRQLSALYNTRPAWHTGRDTWGAGERYPPIPLDLLQQLKLCAFAK